jgi:hypothetical protein
MELTPKMNPEYGSHTMEYPTHPYRSYRILGTISVTRSPGTAPDRERITPSEDSGIMGEVSDNPTFRNH